MERYIEVGRLQVGMYVVRLDRPWLETPFLTQGFPIGSKKLIQEIARYCDHVYIDTDEGVDIDVSFQSALGGSTAPSRSKTAQEISTVIETRQLPKAPVVYERQTSFTEEAEAITEVYEEVRDVIDDVYESAKLDKPIDTRQPKALVQKLASSVIRNPDATSWIANLKHRDQYTAEHSMNVCMLALVFGRHCGLQEEALLELGLGGLLHDIGKLRTPLEILNKPDKLTDQEMNIMRYHPTMGRDLLLKSSGVSDHVVDVAYSHHEREGGDGYPRRLKAGKLSLYSKMVALVDVYDAITSDRCYHDGMAPLDALQNVYKWRGKHFDPYLAEQFIQCIGTYPVGSIVALSSEETGIVVSVNQKRRLLPQVMLVRDADMLPYEPVKYIDLAKVNDDGSKITITKVLSPGESGIHVQDYIFNLH